MTVKLLKVQQDHYIYGRKKQGMKNCINCGNILNDEATYCHLCETAQDGVPGAGVQVQERKSISAFNDIAIPVLAGLLFIGGTVGHIFISNGDIAKRLYAMQGLGVLIAFLRLAGTTGPLSRRLDSRNDSFLNILCGITVISCLFDILSVLGLDLGRPVLGMGWLIKSFWLLMLIVKLAGVVLMFKKRLIGLYVYSLAAAAIIIYGLVLVVMDIISHSGRTEIMLHSGLIVIYGLFLAMYWKKSNRALLQ